MIRPGVHVAPKAGGTVALALVALALGALACNSSFESTLNPSGVSCEVSASMPTQSLAAGGGRGSFNVVALPECAWKIAAGSSWITGLTPASGQGQQQVTFAVAANPTQQVRQGEIVINNLRFTVSQEAAPAPPPPPPPTCTYTLATTSTTVAAAGGSLTVGLTTGATCPWTVQSQASWISVTSPSTGLGPVVVALTIAPNSGTARTGTVQVANQTFTVNQAAASSPPPPTCTYTLATASASVTASGGSLTVGLTTGATCTWTVQSLASWITVTSLSTGSGPTVVALTVAPNSGNARTGTVQVANQTFTVNQAAPCSYSVKPERFNVKNTGDTGLRIDVATTAGCAWTAVSNATWITITAGASGTGSGVTMFNVAANPTSGDRSSTITIAGQTVRVDQD